MSSPKAIKTNSSILEAAREVLRSEGIERLSMDRVAAQAGVSKGAVMYHFPTKRALQAALIEDYAEHMRSGLKDHKSLFEGDSMETLIPGYVEWYKSFNEDNHGWAGVGVQLLSQQAKDPELLKPLEEWYRQLFASIEKLPAKRRTKMLMAVMALEGFFFVKKFGLGTMSHERQQEVLKMILDMTGTADVARKVKSAS